MRLERRPFGLGKDGSVVERVTLASTRGVEVELCSWGATVIRVRAPDRAGVVGDVALGSDDLAFYLAPHPHMGSTTGRYANRIAGARFELDGVEHRLAANMAPNHLHGGPRGFHDQPWRTEILRGERFAAARFRRRSPDGEEGYPGNLDVVATYTLDEDGALSVDFHATTDRATVVNLAQHAYWNLRDGGASDVLGHRVWIGASRYTAVNGAFIPSGELAPVRGTPLDFTTPHAIGARIAQISGEPGGYDHNYAIDRRDASLLVMARVLEPESGRTLEVSTTQPGVQFYTGNFLDGSLVGRGGVAYRKRAGFCLETQHFPDSPHHPAFPSTVLRPGQTYAHRAVYRLGVEP